MPETTNPIDGTRIAFDDSGPGEAGAPAKDALILVHGSGLSKAIWRGLGYTRALNDAHRVIGIDLRGHGRSGKPHRPDDYRMYLVEADILAVLDTLGLDAAHYVGYSFGGRVGFSLAANHPERLLSFVSLGGTFHSPRGSVAELFFESYDEALEVGGMPEFLSRWGVSAGTPIDPQTSFAFLANDPIALLAYFRQLEIEPGLGEELLPALATRSLLIAGSRDRQRLLDSQQASRLMPDAVFRELPGRDHGSTLRPADEVLALLTEFWGS